MVREFLPMTRTTDSNTLPLQQGRKSSQPSDKKASPILDASSSSSQSESCTPCGRLLRKVLLENSTSRPRMLLQSLVNDSQSSFSWRPTPDGLQVEIPVVVTQPQSNTQLATSPHSSSDIATTTTDTSEWLSFSCKKCSDTGPERNARAFVMGPTPLSVVVCTNRLIGKSEIEEVSEILTHELVHVYDVRRLQLDLRLCDNLAYSEVRAAREAECYTTAAKTKNPWFGVDNKTCIQQKALAATQNLFGKRESHACVQRVLESALKDRRPFSNVTKATATPSIAPAAGVFPIATTAASTMLNRVSSR
jgi:hypothetical protein